MKTNFAMLVGLPGSGKSTLAQELFGGHSGNSAVIISSDAIREEKYGDANCQEDPGAIFSEMERRTFSALDADIDVIYDATNLNAKKRKALVTKIRQRYKDTVECTCIVVLCPIETCKSRQLNRERKVPDYVIDRMVRSFEVPYYNEGWDKIALKRNNWVCGLDEIVNDLCSVSHDNPHHSLSIGYHCLEANAKIRGLMNESSRGFSDEEKFILASAARYHDIGKGVAKVFHDSKGNPTRIAHYYGHNNIGAYLVLLGWRFDSMPDEVVLEIAALIQWHMMPYLFPKGEEKSGLKFWCEKRGFAKDFFEKEWMLHEADLGAH